MDKPKYRAVIFDLDGTLIDSLEDIADSMNLVLEKKGYPVFSYDEYRLFVGSGVRDLMKKVLPPDKPGDDNINDILDLFRKKYEKNWAKKSKPYTGVPELLDRIKDRGLKTAVLSNKPDDFTKMCVKELLPYSHFEIVLGMRDGVPAKPDPQAALEIALQLKTAPEDFLYIGDTAIDMQTASRAGMSAVGVLWGFRTREELVQNGAKALVGKPLDILELL